MPGAIEELPLFGKRRSSLRRSARATVATADGKGKNKKQAAIVTVWLYVSAVVRTCLLMDVLFRQNMRRNFALLSKVHILYSLES